MKLFDWLKEVNYNKRDWEEFSENEQKAFQPYMINRFLSMNEMLVELVNHFQKYSLSLLHPKNVYKFYTSLIPRNKKFYRYIKSKKALQCESWIIDLLNIHYEQNTKQTEQYLEIMLNTQAGKESLREILSKYGIEEKKIRGSNIWAG